MAAGRDSRQIAEKAALDAICGMMMLLGEVVQQFELAPEGDGLCKGLHGGVKGDFDQE